MQCFVRPRYIILEMTNRHLYVVAKRFMLELLIKTLAISCFSNFNILAMKLLEVLRLIGIFKKPVNVFKRLAF